MTQKSRGIALTIFEMLFAVLALLDFAKPFAHDPGTGFVFLGHRLAGKPNAVMGPLFGILLLVFAYGIWTMRRYALPVAYIFTGWVIVNMALYRINYPNLHPPLNFTILSTGIGVGIPLATAIFLSRRSSELA